MKPVSSRSQSSDTLRPLSFAWRTCEQDGLRLCLAVFLTFVIFLAAWFSLRIVVPASIAADGPRLGQAQLILLGQDADPALLGLLDPDEVPSLAVEEAVGEAPLLEVFLSQLGLSGEEETPLRLYPVVEGENEFAWPELAEAPLTLPSVPAAPAEMPVEVRSVEWQVRLKPMGVLAELWQAKEFPWELGVPLVRERELLVSVDEEGRTVAASLLGAERGEEVAVRKLWERALREWAAPGTERSGLVAIEFYQK